MPEFQFKHIETIKNCDLSQGLYLWIIHVTKIPPHVGISLNGNYYSLKINGVDDLSYKIVEKVIIKKEIPTIFVKLTENDLFFKRFLSVKNSYQRIISGETTCLTPINNLLLEKKLNLLLPELLEILSLKKQIENVFGLNLPNAYSGIIAYETTQVNNRLNELNDAKRAKHIS